MKLLMETLVKILKIGEDGGSSLEVSLEGKSGTWINQRENLRNNMKRNNPIQVAWTIHNYRSRRKKNSTLSHIKVRLILWS